MDIRIIRRRCLFPSIAHTIGLWACLESFFMYVSCRHMYWRAKFSRMKPSMCLYVRALFYVSVFNTNTVLFMLRYECIRIQHVYVYIYTLVWRYACMYVYFQRVPMHIYVFTCTNLSTFIYIWFLFSSYPYLFCSFFMLFYPGNRECNITHMSILVVKFV